ncbi:hypothetical protein F9K07_16595 [Hydrogenophaga sp. BPS33]|nr:hypothetical protein F9K07_16595 [Hydrogenophaga sp. BPS33]
MLLAMDFLTAHRVARDHTYDVGRITAMRAVLEERVLRALAETDTAQMPADWSWRHAAHEIAVRIALDLVEEER